MRIDIQWDGAHKIDDVVNGLGKNRYGLYHYVAHHPVYGPNSLVYIGLALGQDVSTRLSQHAHNYWSSSPIEICIGELLVRDDQPNIEQSEWKKMIQLAESLLIYTHSPSWNSSNVKSINSEAMKGVQLMNWGNRLGLLPEVTYDRWCWYGNKTPERLAKYIPA